MKRFLLLLALAGGISATASAQNAAAPAFKFEKGDVHDFGTLPEGPVAEYAFKFKNVGKAPLIIQNASASCGCTTPNWTKEPILPGKTGTITVQYNTQGRVGPFEKSIWIQSNSALPESMKAGGRYELKIKGTVEKGAGAKN